MRVLALIPARQHSKGCPGKNLRVLGEHSLLIHALHCAYGVRLAVGDCVHPVVTTDIEHPLSESSMALHGGLTWIKRPTELAQDDTAMVDVVRHALTQIEGPLDEIIVLLQPTQPFRQPCHVQAAIALLQESGADSVVSVVELPRTHHPNMQLWISRGLLCAWSQHQLGNMPACRQEMDARPTFIKDGTVYAFRRATVERYGNIYGNNVRPLLMAPEDTCELDTEEQWAEVERRWKERHG
jgi:CMP-N,N'-diacetyllegionaminic acid synthase